MIEIRFLRHYGSYNGGEIAGFADRDALALVASGNAELFKRPASLAELEAEVLKAGYKSKAAKILAQERFDGKYGEGGRYLRPPAEAKAEE